MPTQLKFTIDSSLATQFKQAVLKRTGKLDLSREGAEALRLYLSHVASPAPNPDDDPILKVIGIATSRGKVRPNALQDKHRLYDEA